MSLNLFFFILSTLFLLNSVYSYANFYSDEQDISKICGKSSIRNGKIIGGEDATEGEFPWMVLIKVFNNSYCGGTIIDREWILTAGHCLHKKPTKIFTVRLGSTKSNSESAIEIPIKKYFVHHNINRYRYLYNDIALIKVEPIKFTDKILPICLSNELNSTSLFGTISGWGLTNTINPKSNEGSINLKKVTVPILNNEKCELWFKENFRVFNFNDGQFCAGYEAGGKDACKIDSGGPLMIKRYDRTEVFGIISSGIGCALAKLPGVYTKVAYYYQWIKTIMSKN